jgi:hypothetical protein
MRPAVLFCTTHDRGGGESRHPRLPAAVTDQNALLIVPPSTRSAAPVVADANGLAM